LAPRPRVLGRTRDRGHGRIEHRTLKAVTVHHSGLPHAAPVLRVTLQDPRPARHHPPLADCHHQPPVRPGQPRPAGRPAARHWAIEALHHVREVTFAEDASRVRTGAGPGVMACLRNLVIGVLCRTGPVNVAAELRRHARDPRRPLATLGIRFG
jgi:hypothetical protein